MSVTVLTTGLDAGDIFCVECPFICGKDEYNDDRYCDNICMFKQDGCKVIDHTDAEKSAANIKILEFYCPTCKELRTISSDHDRVLVIDASQVQEYMAHISVKRNEDKMKKEMGRYKISAATGQGTDIGRGMDIGGNLPSTANIEQIKLDYKLHLDNMNKK
jgi:hypothetical protein